MSDIELRVPFPLDDDGFVRRECPFCCRQFKLPFEAAEVTKLAQKSIDAYMVDAREEEEELDEGEEVGADFHCPYCGQEAPGDCWWTQEQLAYIGVVAHNILAKTLNEELIRPLKEMSYGSRSSLASLRFSGDEVDEEEPWISPEPNDMEVFDLPCCTERIKIEEGWASTVHCCFCGFAHEPKSR